MEVFENHLIAPYTTINLGGEARFFCNCNSEEDLRNCVKFSKENNYRLKIIAGGSNVIFPDEGFRGVVAKIEGEDIKIIKEAKEFVLVETWAGTDWDNFVKWSIENSFSGIECMSGIPGSCGATVIQNVGAYGQEISNVINEVITFDIESGKNRIFKNEDCKFGYRTSVFKNVYKGKVIITKVVFRLSRNTIDDYSYPDLKNEITKYKEYSNFSRIEKLKFIRNAVYKIRKSKSMIYDKNDPYSISCGSFFLNPILNREEFEKFYSLAKEKKLDPPYFKVNTNYKIPAAYLIEKSGFYKGYIKNGAGISKKHSLALVNFGCSTESLLNLANDIKDKVKNEFGISLEIEPDIIK
ncbi:MAG: UDP-N-acetylmuramate dehydrogenase [Ignavibacteria bacterium]|nr:UDP-N-acetylmuramate dehydrogenase [Ignavibacteria bacterium]